MKNRRRLLGLAALACVVLLTGGCGSAPAEESSAPASGASDEWGSYPAHTSLDEIEVVQTYVKALNDRDGQTFCEVVAPWISGRIDIATTDPDSPFRKPIRCPEFISSFIGYIEDCCPPKFRGAELVAVGQLRRRAEVVGIPITVNLDLEESDSKRRYREPLEDIVWVTRDSGAWRIAKLSEVAAAASIALDTEGDRTAAPDVALARHAFADEFSEAKRHRERREESYTRPTADTECDGARRYDDAHKDVVDYLHPAPPTPTPQLPAADIEGVEIDASSGRICVVFEMAGEIRPDTTLKFSIRTPGYEWGRSGFAQGFDVELRGDEVRVSSGLDSARRSRSVPADVGLNKGRLRLILDEATFAAGEAYPGSERTGRPLERFEFTASATVILSPKRYLHDDLGPPAPSEGISRYAYP